jgi:phage recombination protein Bet
MTRTVAKGATADELGLFLYTAHKVGLDPLAKQIYCIKRGGQMTIQTGIDGLRAIAERTKELAGMDDIVYDKDIEKPDNVKTEPANPTTATAKVYRMVGSQRVAFTATARWKEYKPAKPNDFMWNKMPYLMLGKVAESLALRKAFPNDISGIYATEEMEQASGKEEVAVEVIDDKKKTPKNKKKTENLDGEVIIDCEGDKCTAAVTEKEAEYSKKLYKGVFCRECMKNQTPVKVQGGKK